MNSLHPALTDAINSDLIENGDASGVVGVIPVGGGCISKAARLDTGKKSYFLKWNHKSPPGMFAAEAAGLHLLFSAQTIRVPEVLSFAEGKREWSYILMEWISPAQQAAQCDQGLLGSQLASLHQIMPSGGFFGLDHDNYIGSSRQINGWAADWVSFYKDKRLQPQIGMAIRNSLASGNRLRKLRYVADNLNKWIGAEKIAPSLLHGDLWGGNVIAGGHYEPVLIDPAVYYGNREAELAFTEMFGGFSAEFYRAYQEVWPLENGYTERRDIYNLYHLLNHLNIFGGSYGYQVDSILQRYAP